MLGLLVPQMTLEPCPNLAFLPRLSPDLVGARGWPYFPLIWTQQFTLLTWTGKDQMFSEGPSSVTGQAARLCCRNRTH